MSWACYEYRTLESTRGREIIEQEMSGKIIGRRRPHAAVGDQKPNILSKLKYDDSINQVHEKDADVCVDWSPYSSCWQHAEFILCLHDT